MRKSLYWKLALAFMLVAITTAGLVAVFIRLTSADSLTQLILDQQRSSLQQASAGLLHRQRFVGWRVSGHWQQIQQVPGGVPAAKQGFPAGWRRPAVLQGTDRRNMFGLADADGR